MLLQPEDYKLCGALPHAKETRRYTHVVKNVVFVVLKHYDVNTFTEEDKFIEEGMRATSRQKTTFYHYESKFMKCDQTVVIWCLQDFLRRKE
jgi:hypothetical protein